MGNRNEAETRAELIDPALEAAGWRSGRDGVMVRRELVFTDGRLVGGGRRGRRCMADYVLEYRGRCLAVIEAKPEGMQASEGLEQAKKYAAMLDAPFAFASNGRGIRQVDMRDGSECDLGRYPAPKRLWDMVHGGGDRRKARWRRRFDAVPHNDRGGRWQLRYYQRNAIERTLGRIAGGDDRILLTMATGTGKTAIAFQIAWKLFQSRWNLAEWRAHKSGGSRRHPRILFLADRNILAHQAYNEFGGFDDRALVRIDPAAIKRRGRMPQNGSVFFAIFQTFMAGGDGGHNFHGYPADFFDLVIVDECHRGGARDESSWRGILEHFAPAVQLGLTATPRREENRDTYGYFGEPAYVYSLRDGIDDGFLTPFKVLQIDSNIDKYILETDDEVEAGLVDAGREYAADDINRIIEIKQREEYRVQLLLERIDHGQKTIVFCQNQRHALAIRDLINGRVESGHPDYCVRVTADEGEVGEQHLRHFQDNERAVPTILTTSRKLSTGVDARNIRNIAIMRPVRQMVEFKQIIGRGTRIYDDKDFFTIIDFDDAYKHFQDPDWDGEPLCPVCGRMGCTSCTAAPLSVCERCNNRPCTCPPPVCPACRQHPCICPPAEPRKPPEMARVTLSDKRVREFRHSTTTSYCIDGRPVSARQFIEHLYGWLPQLFDSEEQLRGLWSRPDTRRNLLDKLAEKGAGAEQLRELSVIINAEQSDLYDVLAYIAWATPTMTRTERAAASRPRIFSRYQNVEAEFIAFVLDHYIKDGVTQLDTDNLTGLLKIKFHDSLSDAAKALGTPKAIRHLFQTFQQHLYHPAPA